MSDLSRESLFALSAARSSVGFVSVECGGEAPEGEDSPTGRVWVSSSLGK